MDGRSGLVLVCALSGCAWALLCLAVLGGRLRARRRQVTREVVADEPEWRVPNDAMDRIGLGDAAANEAETRRLLSKALRSGEPELRLASITVLGRLAYRYEWAIDGLVEALAEGVEDAVRVATQLDRLAPRPGSRLPALLGHPSSVVRFYAVRLLARYGPLASRHVPRMTEDTSSNVRAAALETLRAVSSGEALRCALRMLEDPNPLVRAHASRTAAAIAPITAAPYVVPLLSDRSWWVREAARESLVAGGGDVTPSVERALHDPDATLRSGAALVLQDLGVLDALVNEDDLGRLERILDAGGNRLRDAATDRARTGIRLGQAPSLGAEVPS
jgi:HEAT repeat protein